MAATSTQVNKISLALAVENDAEAGVVLDPLLQAGPASNGADVLKPVTTTAHMALNADGLVKVAETDAVALDEAFLT